MGCLADPQVHDFVAGQLDGPALAAIDAHLDGCVSCRELVGSVRRALSGDGADAGDSMSLPVGAQVGRFEIGEVLGRGAMGVVYAARDPRLERPVALKLLRADREGDASSLLAEAKAMARVSHPNVVAVYDVDALPDSDADLYVAMELVDGETLRFHLERGPYPWRSMLGLLIGAGWGLATAHRAGVLHRDLKPENVLIGADGRARVTDFGLARAGAFVDVDGALELGRTQTSMAGTPAYMAPELFSGAPSSARSDQFSFCVTAFEALTGRRPFEGADLDGVLAAARAGAVRWPADRAVPPAVKRVIARGLAADPSQRWPSMDALLEALGGAARGRRVWWLGAATGVALVGAAVAIVVLRPMSERPGSTPDDPCAAVAAPIDVVWSPAPRATLAAHFERAGAGEAFGLAGAALDRYASAWTEMRIDACRATHARRDQSAELLDLRMLCLDRRLGELGAIVDRLGAATPPVLADAPRIISGLPAIGACGDVAALREVVPPPADPAARARLAALGAELDRALAADAAGDAAGARSLAERVVAGARALEYGPLLAEALQVLASSSIDLGELQAAEVALDEALIVASKALDHQRVAQVSVARVYFVGAKQQQLEAALALTSAARAAVAQAGDDPGMTAALHMNVGVVYDLAGKRAEAEVELGEALRLFRSQGADTPREGDVLHNLGALAMDRGDYAAARERFGQALALRRRVLGAQHPAVADTLVGLGAIARREQHNADARAFYDQAAAIYRAVYGDGHAQLGAIYNNLAIISEVELDFDQALADHERALAIRRATYGDEHPLIAQSLNGIGNTLSAQGKHADALARYRESLALRRKVYPAGHPGIAIGLHGLAGALSATGEVTAAVAARHEALEILEKAQADPLDLAEIRFAQAADLWMAGDERRRAIALARRARAAYAAGGEPAAANLARVDAWLAAHRM